MKVKRAKAYKKAMNLYVQSFGFRKPYQVIVDSEFIQVALDQKIDPVYQIPKVLLDSAKQMVTPCTIAKLRSLGDEGFGAFLAAKRLEKRRCPHQTAVDEHECIAKIISNDNKHRYLVGSQSKKLRALFRQVPGVPLLYINRSVLILEPPSEATTLKVQENEHAKTHATQEEMVRLKATTVRANGHVVVDRKLAEKVEKSHEKKLEKLQLKKQELAKKRKGAKEPNPLSVKKKKKETTTTTTTTTTKSTTEVDKALSSTISTLAEGSAAPAPASAPAPTPTPTPTRAAEAVVLTSAEKKKQKKKEAKKLKRKMQQQQHQDASSAGEDSD
ncbi:hypothetical protein DFQ27_006520 [Actinomortierella ambigua]|uniref:U three protein 23 n=1 Tax=Actinomortierella ambigua TaxID=1343610 RepID=A0A9P6PW35_9FUNG|nr:hypothetical protein DFQ27_006520 [Actinomortierella ambigua]